MIARARSRFLAVHAPLVAATTVLLLTVTAVAGAQEARKLVGTWSHIMTESSGTGLYTQLELRADGTYEFLNVLSTRLTCVSARREPGLAASGDGIWYTGRYRIEGRNLVITPTAGRRGCTGRMMTLAKGARLDNPGWGNRSSIFRLSGDSLCLRRDGSDTESCLSR